MSANLVVDVANTCNFQASVMVGSGSNFTVGNIVDMLDANTYCNAWVATAQGSGQVSVRVQTSDDTTSGSFTDPTSGLGQIPISFVSGGVLICNSGLPGSGYSTGTAPVASAPLSCSGDIFFGAFQRPHRYARMILDSGSFPNWIIGGFLSNARVTGSGGGQTQSPGSGSVSV